MTTTDTRQNSIAAVCEALACRRQDWPLFSRWAAGPLTPKTLDELNHYVDVMIADRCRRSTDDLLAKLIELEVDGEELTVDDIRRFVAALVGRRELAPCVLGVELVEQALHRPRHLREVLARPRSATTGVRCRRRVLRHRPSAPAPASSGR